MSLHGGTSKSGELEFPPKAPGGQGVGGGWGGSWGMRGGAGAQQGDVCGPWETHVHLGNE